MSAPVLAPIGRVFVWCIVLGGAAALATSVAHLASEAIPPEMVVLGALAALSGAAVLRMRVVPATFSIGDTFSFTVLFLYGPEAAAVTVALDTLAISLRLGRVRLGPMRFLFNIAAPSLAMWLAGLAPIDRLELARVPFGDRVVPLVGSVALAATLFFLLNSGFVATAVALERREHPIAVWKKNFLRLWPGPFTGAYAGGMLAFLARSPAAPVALLFLPIPLIVYFAFRTWLARIDADLRHLADMERAYLSMIQAFATAIDSKDQTTHGHILRVQTYALALARALGVVDKREIKALEAAALLHDLGKIGIPDHILNKPGRLAPPEFEIMKKHVAIGTEILANIAFPYPVVPIVRSHHEFWNGQGYPDGLQGSDIPIGARILSVVDCFDALTSDRPYRRGMSSEEAFAIILERRGTMYDPTVVDTFMRIQQDVALAPEAHAATSIVPATQG
jgi:putative nucleotidyltransferase with HDIG domain